MLYFAIYAPGNYPIDNISGSHKTNLDIVFSVLLIVNDACVILSFVEFLRIGWQMISRRKFTLKLLINILLSLYPVIVVAVLCGWSFSVFLQYQFAPIQIIVS